MMNRFLTEQEAKENNVELLRQLMDERIHDIPEIETVRSFIMGRYEEDEIYFYLMCRHKFLEGN